MFQIITRSLSLPIIVLVVALPVYAAPSADQLAQINLYSARAGHQYRHGVIATVTAHERMTIWLSTLSEPLSMPLAGAGAKTLSYGGGVDGIGVTSGSEHVYLVFYGSQWGKAGTDAGGLLTLANDKGGVVPFLQAFYSDLGTGGEQWSSVMTQYCDGPNVAAGVTECPVGAHHIPYPNSRVLAGVWYDDTGASPVYASAHDLASEAVKAAQHFGNVTALSNRYVQYVIVSPPGMHPDGFNTVPGGDDFCAWHDHTADSALDGGPVSAPFGSVAFTNLPYSVGSEATCGAGFVNSGPSGELDGVTINAGHEYAETLTDQRPTGGWTNQGPSSAVAGEENGDECSWIAPGTPGGAGNVRMGAHIYAMQATWSNELQQCQLEHPSVAVK